MPANPSGAPTASAKTAPKNIPKTAPKTTPLAGCPIYLSVQMDGQHCEVRLGDAWRLNPEPQGLERLRSQLADAELEVVYGP